MDVAVVRQFLNFFQDFLDLCQWKDWPSTETTEAEIRNAFIKASHIDKCLDKLQKNYTLNDFLATLNCTQDSTESNAFLKTCLAEPVRYILKKIINSNSKIMQVDIAFKIFLQLYSAEKLEGYLTELILEAASKGTLLKKLPTEVSQDEILKFKSEIFLSQITNESKECLQEMLKKCDKDSLELLVVSLCSTEPQFQNSVNLISRTFLDVLISKNNCYKSFWKLLFGVEDKYLISMCVENSDLYTYICEAIIDCGKLLKENMSAEYFYIEFTYSELVSIVRKLFSNEFLKAQFVNILVNDHGTETDFWQSILH